MEYKIELVSYEKAREVDVLPEFEELFHDQFVFDRGVHFPESLDVPLNEGREKRRLEFNAQEGFGVIAKDGDKFIGYTYVRPQNYEPINPEYNSLYTDCSAVLPEYQGQGVYKAMAQLLLAEAKKRGYTMVVSEHNLTNNAIIAPKIKMGFVVMGQSVWFGGGTMVKLAYPLCEKVRLAFDVRAGFKKPTKDLMKNII